MAVITRYVNTASVGGDGTTNNTSGATAAYASLSAWNTAEATDLVTAGNTHIVYCSGTADVVAQNTVIDMVAWTTNATNYVTIQVDPSNRSTLGYLDTSKYHISKTATGTWSATLKYSANTRILGLQFLLRTNNGITTNNSLLEPASTSDHGVQIGYCIFDVGGTDTSNYGRAWNSLTAGSSSNPQYFYNNLVMMSSGSTGAYAVATSLGAATDNTFFYNNTFIDTNGNCTAVITLGACTSTVWTNNIFQGFADDWTFSTGNVTGSDYNLTTNASLETGSNNVTSTTLTFAGSGSYKLVGSDTSAIGAALDDPGSGLFSDDALGTTRSDWDIGAFEYVAPSGLTITSVNTTNTAFSAQTDSSLVGTGLSASVVCTYAGIACANESASSSTSLKITFPNFFTNNIKLGRDYEFKVVG